MMMQIAHFVFSRKTGRDGLNVPGRGAEIEVLNAGSGIFGSGPGQNKSAVFADIPRTMLVREGAAG
jgi:hypothetical protein